MVMQGSYWQRVVQRRLSRRRALAAAGAAAAGAALLAACGGEGDSGGGPKDTSGLLYQMVDETKKVRRGGTYVDSHPNVLVTLDPMKTGAQIRVARRGYSQLFRVADGVLERSSGSIEGDLAESWELAPDKLTLTLKLEPGASFAPVAPVNGRVADADDVLFSWERLKKDGVQRKELANELNPAAPILSMAAPDKKTIVVKLSEPNATVFSQLGTDALGSLYILPKEAVDPAKLNVPRQAIGTGPYYLSEASEIFYRWKKNPGFKRAKLKDNEPYIDEVYSPVIPEIATGSAQFRAGAIYEYGVPAREVIQTKRDISALLMRATDPTDFTERLYFGQNADSPFKDERVRIAYMKCLDRDAFIGAAYNTDQFAKEGLPVAEFWEGAITAAAYAGWYLDPRSKDFGANAKNYLYDLAEAKKLVEAAGYKTPLEFTETYAQPAPTSFPATYYTRAEIFLGAIESSGVFKMKRSLVDYATGWSTEAYRFSQGKFTGATWGPDTARGDPTWAMFFAYNSKGGLYMGGDAKLDELTNKARLEFDDKKRAEMLHDIQRYEAGKMFSEKIGVAGGFALAWPVLRNVAVYRGGTNWMCITSPSGLRAFIDPAQPPLKKA